MKAQSVKKKKCEYVTSSPDTLAKSTFGRVRESHCLHVPPCLFISQRGYLLITVVLGAGAATFLHEGPS